MKFMARVLLTTMLVLCVGLPVKAQFVVFDPTNFTQNLQQVAHMLTQLKRLQTQIEMAKGQWDTAKSQLEAMKGSRGMGRILTEAGRDYIPRNWQETLNAAGEIRNLANDIKASANYLSDKDLSRVNRAYLDALRASGDAAVNGMAANTMVFQQSGDRFQRLQVLMDKIESADDQKAIEDLQARIQIEQVMLENELIRAQSMNAMIQQQAQIREERDRQLIMSESFDYYQK